MFIVVVDLFVFLDSVKMDDPCLLCTGWNAKLLQDDRCKLKPLLNQMNAFVCSLSTPPILHIFGHFSNIFLRADQDGGKRKICKVKHICHVLYKTDGWK